MIKKIILLICFMILFVPTISYCKVKVEKKQRSMSIENVIKLIERIAKREDVDITIAKTFAKIESDFRPEVFNANDPSHGLYQMAFDTARHFNKDIKNIRDMYSAEKNATGGIRFIKYLLKTYSNLSVGEIAQIYNLGETKYNKGIRSSDYEVKFMKWYNQYNKKP